MKKRWLSIFGFLVGISPVGGQTLPTTPVSPEVVVARPITSALGDGAITFSEVAGNTPRVWFSTEYLMWWVKKGNTPPMVITGRPADDFNDVTPALGQPETRVLFGGSGALDYNTFSGLRGTFGFAVGDGWGVEISGFMTEQRSRIASFASDAAGNPPLGVSYLNTDPLGLLPAPYESSYLVTNPDPDAFLTGSVTVTSSLRLWGAEANAVRLMTSRPGLNSQWIIGFRYAGLDESLNIFTDSSWRDPGTNDVLNFQSVHESFSVHNQFYGGQIGAAFSWVRGALNVDFVGKVALGVTHQTVSVAGSSFDSFLGPLNQGSIYAYPTNIGSQERNAFSVIPQVQIKAGYNLTNNVRAFVGYDFLFWSNVVRAGDQINRTVNASQGIGGAQNLPPNDPQPVFNRTDFWAHGVSFGFELKY